MRIRTVKPEWLEDEKIASASDEARVLSVALILMSDDYGNGRASMATIATTTWRFAMERDDGAHAPEVLKRASRAFQELLSIGFVEAYQVNGQRYFSVRNWEKHQKVMHPGKPHVPGPECAENKGKAPSSGEPHETLMRVSDDPHDSLMPDLRIMGPKDPDQDPDPSRVTAPERGTPMDPLKPQRGILLRAHRRRYSEATGHDVPPGKNSAADIAEVVPWLVGYAQKTGQSFEQAAEAVLERWWKDPYAAGKGWPLWHLAKHVDEFAEALPARLTVAKATGGMVPVSSREEHAADAAEGTAF